MTKMEGMEMRAYLHRQELLKTSAGQFANRYRQAKPKVVDAEYMQRFGEASLSGLTKRIKTEEESTIEDLVKNFK